MSRILILLGVCLNLIVAVTPQSSAIAIGEECDMETTNTLIDGVLERFEQERSNAQSAADLLAATETMRDNISLILEACSSEDSTETQSTVEEPAVTEPTVGEPIVYYVIRAQPDAGIPIGCDESAVPIETEHVTTGDVRADLRTAIDTLIADDTLFNNGNVNALRGNTLRVLNVTVRNEFASVSFSGSLDYEDECEGARMEAQIVLTVFQFPTLTRFQGAMGGRNMRQFFGDLDAGLSGEYLRETFIQTP